jgi:hypothetical protein
VLPSEAMRRIALAAALVVATATSLLAQEPRDRDRDPLTRARMLYNEKQYGPAIAAADEARRDPSRAAHADLIAARAYLERFRLNSVRDDLDGARMRLRRIDPTRFTQSEQYEFLVGLGQSLYLDQELGAAATIFESLLFGNDTLLPDARDRLLDWWASALDHDARSRTELDRRTIYQRVRDRMLEELAHNPGSGTAAYWSAAAARGQGDLQAAWDAAEAGWVRAVLTADGGDSLRADLDRLMLLAIVPERSRILAQPADTLAQEWEAFKERWAR